MRALAAASVWGLVAFAGLAQAVSLAEPWTGQPLWWLQLASLGLLFSLLAAQPTWARAGLMAWLFALTWLAATWWWLFISMHVYGGLPAPLAALAVFALATFLGSYYAAAGALAWRLARGRRAWSALLFAAAWLLAELMRGVWFTGFPWGAGGYAHVEGPLSSLAPLIGVYGIGFVAALLAALAGPTLATVDRRFGGAAAALVLLVAVVALPHREYSRPVGTFSVALLQGNIAQDEKFQGGTGVPLALDWYARELVASRASLVVAPETAIPLLPHELPQGYLEGLAGHFGSGGQAALLGIPLGSFDQGYANSVIGLRAGAQVYRFDKHHLVPFGEFIPPLFRWFTNMMNIPLGDFNRGGVGQPSFEWLGQRIAPNVCYEDLFGEELAERFVRSAEAPTVFVNVSNIGWFGDTVAIDQHLHISRMRALEFQRPMIRATNTGATALVGHRGVVTQQLPRLTRAVLTGQVEGRDGMTPFARWSAAWGLWPLWAVGLGIVLAAAARRPAPASASHPGPGRSDEAHR